MWLWQGLHFLRFREHYCGVAGPLHKLRVFVGFAEASKVSMTDNLRRKGSTSKNIVETCSLCRKEGEMINHRFLHCDFVTYLWNYFFRMCGLSWCLASRFTCSFGRGMAIEPILCFWVIEMEYPICNSLGYMVRKKR